MPLSRDLYVTSNDLSPIQSIKVVTPNDSTDLPDGPCRAMILNGAGNIRFDTLNGETVTLAISSAWFGVTYIRAKRIYASGTTIGAGSIFACY
jgi:hypothetical protein